MSGMDAAALDAADALAPYRARFVGSEDPGILYLDGNSLGRPVRDLPARLTDFVEHAWGERLIRSWDEGWFDQPQTLGDRLGRVVLGAAPWSTGRTSRPTATSCRGSRPSAARRSRGSTPRRRRA
jgi:kynureninase